MSEEGLQGELFVAAQAGVRGQQGGGEGQVLPLELERTPELDDLLDPLRELLLGGDLAGIDVIADEQVGRGVLSALRAASRTESR